MAHTVIARALTPASLSLFAAGLSVAAGAALAGSPAFAADHHTTTQPARSTAAATHAAATHAASPQTGAQEGARQGTAEAVLKVAESQIGVAENAAGGGTPFHSWYMSSQRAAETVARDGGSLGAYAN
ncbi:CHAP domain-containing protein, partial [Nonomuraea turkmeniaca]